MTSPTLLEALARGVEEFFAPLAEAAEDTPAGRERLADILRAIGVDVESQDIAAIQSSLSAFVTTYESVADAVGGDPGSSLLSIVELLADAQEVVKAVEDVSTALQGVDPEDVVPALLEYLAAVSLQRTNPQAYYAAVLLTVVDVEAPETLDPGTRNRLELGTHTSAAGGAASLELDRIGDLLDSPVEELRDAYLPDGPLTDEELATLEARVFPWLAAGAAELGIAVDFGDGSTALAPPYDRSDVSYSRRVTLSKRVTDSARLSVTLALASTPDGLALLVASSGDATVDETVGDWELAVSLTGETGPSLLRPDGIDPLDSSSSPEATATARLSKLPDPDTGASFVLGPTEGTRLELGDLDVEGTMTATDEGVETGVLAAARNSAFVVDAGNADSFLKKMLPEDGVTVDFDAGIGWGTERGLYFQGGGGLDTELPVNLNIADVLSVDTLQLAAKPDTSGETVTIPVHVAADPQVSLGPIDAVVEGIGLEAEIAFPEGQDGNLGPLDVSLGFKPPDGAGLSVDAGAVTGGGYLEFDPDNERYAGVLQLQVGELTLTAVGLLTTQLPGGRDGFSLLLIISGEFPPMQLGFGFTLNAVGGLLGINRTMDVDYLVAGVSDGTVSSIMFPEDPVRNAPQIISDLRNGFPVAAGNHVFGPMGRLGWGAPTMLSADVGVLLELPDPIRIAILGRVHAGLPHEEVGIVVFNMDVVGAVDFGEGNADASATLYDSRVLAYTLTGDMAMKTGWGDDPTFVLSVGGFNPRFDPPEDFPELRRIALSLGPGNPRIRWEGYFAMTANTLQVGARVEIYAAAAGFSFEGKVGFDTLFRFDPFELIADFYAGFTLMRGGSTIMSVDLDGTLSGPGPWHVTGKASFEIWPLEFSVSVDEEFGQSESAEGLPPADVFGEVVDALGDERNWSAQRPEDGDSVVTLRQVEPKGDQVLAHPLGQFSVRQKVAPLAVRLETYSGATPADYDRFEIVDVSVGEEDEGAGEPTREQFARGEYFDLSDDEKLEGPEFERYEAGSHVTNTGFGWGGMDDDGLLGGGVLEYETAVIDEEASFEPIVVAPIAMPQSTAESLAAVSAVARGPLRTTGTARFETDEEEASPTGVDDGVSVGDSGFVVARTDDLTRVDLDLPPDGTTKREAEEALAMHLDSGDRDRGDYQIVGAHEAVDGEGDQ